MSPSHKMPALNHSALWGALLRTQEDQGLYLMLRLQKIQLQLREAQIPSLPFRLPVPSTTYPETLGIGGGKSVALASVLGAQWGTFMPYLFLRGFLNKPPSLRGGTTLLSGRHCDKTCQLVLPFTHLGSFRPLEPDSSQPSVYLCHLGWRRWGGTGQVGERLLPLCSPLL